MAIAEPKPEDTTPAGGWKATLAKYWYPREYLLGGAFLLALGLGTVWGAWQNLCAGDACPSIAQVRTFEHEQTSKILAADGRQITEFGFERRTPISIFALPDYVPQAVIAVEDKRFYQHGGFDPVSILRAVYGVVSFQSGSLGGGSTITQQLAKNLFLTREKTLIRKVKEFVLARRLDDALSKPRILELYLNVVELGPMVYGIGHAAQYYFGKPPSALTVRECSFLASMLPGPKVYNPYRKMDRVMKRSDRILRRMLSARMISREEYDAALSEVPNLEGIARKVEKTLETPPPAENPPGEAPGGGPVVIEPSPPVR